MSATGSALRPLRRDSGLSALIAVTVALGVGVATALFGYYVSFVRPRLAAPHAERIVSLRNLTPRGPLFSFSSAEVEAMDALPGVELQAATTVVNATVRTDAGNLFAWGRLATGTYLELFGGRAALGRLLGPGDGDPAAPSTVVLGHRLWRTGFGSDPGVIGRTVELNSERCTIVGIAARDFEGVGFSSEFFLPARLGDRLTGLARSQNIRDLWLNVYARLSAEPGSRERAASALAARVAALDRSHPLPEGEKRRAELVDTTAFDPEQRNDPFFQASRLLAAAGILFVLLGAANLAGLLLARAAARDREWAVRKALGASPARLATAIVGRLVPPALVGLAGALPVAKAVERWIEANSLTPFAGLGATWAAESAQLFDLDGRGVLFAAAATALTLLGAAAPPLLRVLRRDPNRTLRADSAGGGSERAVLAPRRLLVAGQLALAVTLLVGSGLLVRSLRAAATGELGFDPRGLAFASANFPRTGSAGGGAASDLVTLLGLVERARQLGGVADATLALVPPISPASREIEIARAESASPAGEGESVEYNIVGPGYFRTLGVPIVAGRPLDERDRPGAPSTVVVSASLATKLWGHEPAVGRRLRLTGPVRPDEAGPDFEVIGVSADAAFAEPTEPRPATLFFAYGQRRHSRMTLVVRARAPLAQLEPALRELVAATRVDASIIDLVPAEEQLHRTLQPLRLNATVAAGLGLASLATALVGLFALQVYAVNLRRRDFAVRMALGARGGDISRMVLGEASRLALGGLLVGMAAAVAVVRLLGSLLHGVTAYDPWTFALVPLLLAAVVAGAGWLPAHRAARIDPVENLRSS